MAGIWLYHGAWCKLLRRCPEQVEIVRTVPGLSRFAGALLYAIGAVEVALAAWVVSGRAPRLAAATETAFVAGMSGSSLAWGRQHVPAPTALVVENVAFLALVWWAAESDR